MCSPDSSLYTIHTAAGCIGVVVVIRASILVGYKLTISAYVDEREFEK